MRKPILIIGLFVAIATIAFVYATQTTSIKPNPPVITKHITPGGKGQAGNVQFEWKLANPYMLQQAGQATHFWIYGSPERVCRAQIENR